MLIWIRCGKYGIKLYSESNNIYIYFFIGLLFVFPLFLEQLEEREKK